MAVYSLPFPEGDVGRAASVPGSPAMPELHVICQQLTLLITDLHTSCEMSTHRLNACQLVKFSVVAIYFGTFFRALLG